jgi:hypothetical protein
VTGRIIRSPVAITVDGDIILNLTQLDVPARLPAILAALRSVPGPFFVGVSLSAAEVRRFQRDLDLVLPNVTAPIIGQRLRRRSR